MTKTLQEGTFVTLTKSKDTKDPLNKFAGWDSQLVEILKDGAVAKITHPFNQVGQNNQIDKDETIEVPMDRLTRLADDPTKTKSKGKPAKPAVTDMDVAVSPGDKIKLKRAWVTVEKASPAESKTIMTLTSNNTSRRIWRKDILEIQKA